MLPKSVRRTVSLTIVKEIEDDREVAERDTQKILLSFCYLLSEWRWLDVPQV